MIKRYACTGNGQVHARIWEMQEAPATPLVCLHAIPYSGLHFAELAPLLASRRTVICPDYPGYGSSDTAAEHSVEYYATSMLEALDDFGYPGPVDALGFHTGCLVGPEMALQAAARIRRLVLIDVPFFDTAQREDLLAEAGQPPPYSEDLESLRTAWQMNVATKLEKLSLNRCFELLAEQLRTGLRANEGFRAAFNYASTERLAGVRHPCLVIATRSSLVEPSRKAAKLLPNCSLQEFPDLGPPVLDSGAEPLAEASLAFLELP